MIPRSRDRGEPLPAWRKELASAFTDRGSLLAFLGLDELAAVADDGASSQFPLRVPLSFARRMRRRDPADPLLLQVLPSEKEMQPAPGFVRDPVEDRLALRHSGLIRKFQGRALVVTTGACAVHCRYCFRRHFPYGEHGFRAEQFERLREEIAGDRSVTEVILSGGDPLSLSDHRLDTFLDLLAAFDQVQRVRIHTRLPIVLPSRVCDSLLQVLARPRDVRLVIVLHINHAQEIDASVTRALEPLRALGFTLLNQAVLLRGVNDSANTQVALAEACFAAGVLPYYLHLLDRVEGAAHFEVDETAATAIAEELYQRLPGYLVPRLVRETPGSSAKRPVYRIA